MFRSAYTHALSNVIQFDVIFILFLEKLKHINCTCRRKLALRVENRATVAESDAILPKEDSELDSAGVFDKKSSRFKRTLICSRLSNELELA